MAGPRRPASFWLLYKAGFTAVNGFPTLLFSASISCSSHVSCSLFSLMATQNWVQLSTCWGGLPGLRMIQRVSIVGVVSRIFRFLLSEASISAGSSGGARGGAGGAGAHVPAAVACTIWAARISKGLLGSGSSSPMRMLIRRNVLLLFCCVQRTSSTVALRADCSCFTWLMLALARDSSAFMSSAQGAGDVLTE